MVREFCTHGPQRHPRGGRQEHGRQWLACFADFIKISSEAGLHCRGERTLLYGARGGGTSHRSEGPPPCLSVNTDDSPEDQGTEELSS